MTWHPIWLYAVRIHTSENEGRAGSLEFWWIICSGSVLLVCLFSRVSAIVFLCCLLNGYFVYVAFWFVVGFDFGSHKAWLTDSICLHHLWFAMALFRKCYTSLAIILLFISGSYENICICVCVQETVFAYVYTNVCAYVHSSCDFAYEDVWICVCVRIYVRVHVYAFMCAYVRLFVGEWPSCTCNVFWNAANTLLQVICY